MLEQNNAMLEEGSGGWSCASAGSKHHTQNEHPCLSKIKALKITERHRTAKRLTEEEITERQKYHMAK